MPVKPMRRFLAVARLALLALAGVAAAPVGAQTLAPDDGVRLAPAADWVIPEPLPELAEVRAGQGGRAIVLLDYQYDLAGRTERYHHFAFKVLNESGLQSSASVSLDFDPLYQTLTVHALRIIRDGQVIDQLGKARFSLFRRETELDRQMYNGTRTAHFILKDVRVGDIIEYSYTRRGLNPVFQGRYSDFFYLSWQRPVGRFHLRVTTPASRPLTVTPVRTGVAPSVHRRDGETVYDIRLDDVPAFRLESQTPLWYDPEPGIVLSHFSSWQQVAAWATPLYALPGSHDAAISVLAEHIRQTHPGKAEQLVAALRFVQRKVRYVGIEMGVGSWRPNPPAQVLKRRFGDCKDKTMLLRALLRELDIASEPVLVATELRRSLKRLPAAPMFFDHVVLRAHLDGRTWWLDATDTFQGGGLAVLAHLPFDVGLVLDAGSDSLAPIPHADNAGTDNARKVVQVIDLPQAQGSSNDGGSDSDSGSDSSDSGSMRVETTALGKAADNLRYRLANSGSKRLSEKYHDYYSGMYGQIERASAASFDDNPDRNRMRVSEHYRLLSPWRRSENGEVFSFVAYADIVDGIARVPKDTSRKSPFDLEWPMQVDQVLRLPLDGSWQFVEKQRTIENPWFRFSRQVSFGAEHTLKLAFHYNTKADYVPVEGIDAFVKDTRAVRDLLRYQLQVDTTAGSTGQDAGAGARDIIFWVVLLLLVAFAYSLYEYCRDRRAEANFEPGIYFPVSASKLIILSLLSLGVYQVYWGYRNWRSIRQRDGGSLWAWARGLFLPLTLYWLYRDAKNHPRQDDRLRLGQAAIVALALGYLVIGVARNSQSPLYYLAVVLTSLCLLPLAAHIRRINGPDSRALRHHSRWRFRHVFTGALFAALFAYDAATTVYLIPPTTVIRGPELPARAEHFMQRHDLLATDGSVRYYYSDAMWSYQQDGNLVRDNGVLSYWHDPLTGKLLVERASYAQIDRIEVQPGSLLAPTRITVVRTDGSDFILLMATAQQLDQQAVGFIRQQL